LIKQAEDKERMYLHKKTRYDRAREKKLKPSRKEYRGSPNDMWLNIQPDEEGRDLSGNRGTDGT